MRRNTRMLLVATLVAIAVVTSGCELSLNNVDCSFINAPDMGGLVCFGLNIIALNATVIALLLAIIAAVGGALGGALPV